MSPPPSQAELNERLHLRLRSDLEIYPQVTQGRTVFVIKDPLSLRFFRFNAEEFEILKHLNGHRNLTQLKAAFDARFAPRRLTIERLRAFVVQLHRSGLTLSDDRGQAQQLLERNLRQRKRNRLSWVANPLAIRFRGLNPQPLLDWLYPRLRWLFSPLLALGSTALVIVAGLFVLGQYEQILNRLPGLDQLITADNLIWLAVAIGLTKVLHEFGHALACKHVGGDCHEMGFMLLCLTPCLYCNVTDTWKLASRWQRVAVASAGMIIEIILAAICVLLWWSTQPGLFNTLCLNIMLVCSVGTILLNGNPLLRYDGYYILSDLSETPNLWRESRAMLGQVISRFFGLPSSGVSSHSKAHRVYLLCYALASMTYRGVVICAILYFVYRMLKPLGLTLLAHMLTAVLLGGILAGPLTNLYRVISSPLGRRQINFRRTWLTLTVMAGLGAFYWYVPLPCSIEVPTRIEAAEARRVYASVPGRLVEAVRAGARVQAGEVLGRLENIKLQRELQSIRGDVLQQTIRLRSLESMRAVTPEYASQLPTAEQILVDLEQRQSQLERELNNLTLRAPLDGMVIPPPRRKVDPDASRNLPQWQGTPLDSLNHGCRLERQTLFCLVAPKNRFSAVLFIPQHLIEYIQAGQTVRMQLPLAPGQIIRGQISEVSRNELSREDLDSELEPALWKRLEQLRQFDSTESIFQAEVALKGASELLVGGFGRAKVQVGPQTLAHRVNRYLSRLFRPIL